MVSSKAVLLAGAEYGRDARRLRKSKVVKKLLDAFLTRKQLQTLAH